MSLHWFSPPVPVKTGCSGVTCNCNSVEGAAQELLKWAKRGSEWDKAIRACMMCLAGEMTPEDVRIAFKDAAEAEGTLLRN